MNEEQKEVEEESDFAKAFDECSVMIIEAPNGKVYIRAKEPNSLELSLGHSQKTLICILRVV